MKKTDIDDASGRLKIKIRYGNLRKQLFKNPIRDRFLD